MTRDDREDNWSFSAGWVTGRWQLHTRPDRRQKQVESRMRLGRRLLFAPHHAHRDAPDNFQDQPPRTLKKERVLFSSAKSHVQGLFAFALIFVLMGMFLGASLFHVDQPAKLYANNYDLLNISQSAGMRGGIRRQIDGGDADVVFERLEKIALGSKDLVSKEGGAKYQIASNIQLTLTVSKHTPLAAQVATIRRIGIPETLNISVALQPIMFSPNDTIPAVYCVYAVKPSEVNGTLPAHIDWGWGSREVLKIDVQGDTSVSGDSAASVYESCAKTNHLALRLIIDSLQAYFTTGSITPIPTPVIYPIYWPCQTA